MVCFYVLFQVSNRIARIRLLAPAGWLSLETSRRVRSPCRHPPPRTPPSSPPSWAQPLQRLQDQQHQQLRQEQLHRRHPCWPAWGDRQRSAPQWTCPCRRPQPGSVFPCPPPLRRRRGSSPCWRRRSRSRPWRKAEQQQLQSALFLLKLHCTDNCEAL